MLRLFGTSVPVFGMLYQEKFGNPVSTKNSQEKKFLFSWTFADARFFCYISRRRKKVEDKLFGAAIFVDAQNVEQ
jgi:hypothetical protein